QLPRQELFCKKEVAEEIFVTRNGKGMVESLTSVAPRLRGWHRHLRSGTVASQLIYSEQNTHCWQSSLVGRFLLLAGNLRCLCDTIAAKAYTIPRDARRAMRDGDAFAKEMVIFAGLIAD
ncbi:MAG: hypothetical protein GY820_21030, partial [Gammaproteobacteria bacterium]|nr:hypothetical protein [Gammaproteobacteria bacterium]